MKESSVSYNIVRNALTTKYILYRFVLAKGTAGYCDGLPSSCRVMSTCRIYNRKHLEAPFSVLLGLNVT